MARVIPRCFLVRPLFWACLISALFMVIAPAARACSLDGIASLSMNGTTASLTAGTPNAGNARFWAPFTLLAAGRGTAVLLKEDAGKVQRSLTPEMTRVAFRWSFDDGTSARGWSVSHRFLQLGWHRFTVDYYWSPSRRWIEFDSAQIQIVPPGDVLRANFAYHLENVLGTILLTSLRVLVWGGAAVILGAAMLTRVQRAKRARASKPL